MNELYRRALAYFRAHRRQRRWLIGVAAAAVLAVAVLVAIPLVAAAQLESWLRDHGAADAKVEDVDFNPFTGVARLSGLQAGDGTHARLSVGLAELDVRWWPLVSQRAHVQALRLHDVRADVVRDTGVWRVGRIRIPVGGAGAAEPGPAQDEAAADALAWGVGSELVDLRDVQVTYRDGIFDTEVDVRTLRLGSHFSWDAAQSAELVLDLSVDGSPFSLRSDVAPWSDEPSLSGSLTLADLDLGTFAAELETLAGMRGVRGRAAMDLELSGRLDRAGILRVDIAGPFNLNEAGFALAEMDYSHDSLRWDGTVSLALPAGPDQALARLQGALQLTGAAARLEQPTLSAALADLRWQGEVDFTPAVDGQSPRLGLTGGVRLQGAGADHGELGIRLAELAELRLDALNVTSPGDSGIGAMRLDGLELLHRSAESAGDGGRPAVLQLGRLSVADVRYTGEAVTMATVDVTDPVVTLVRDADGELVDVDSVVEAFAGAPDAPQPSSDTLAGDAAGDAAGDEAGPPLTVRVDRLRVDGERWLSFLDESVDPPAAFELATLKLEIEDLDTSGARPLRLAVETAQDNTRLAVSGTAGPFAEPRSAALDVVLENLELPPLSPYVPTYDIFRGRLSSDSRVVLDGEALDVRNDLLIERLRLAGKTEDGDGGLLAEGMAMPVDVALDLLRDRDDRIRLELPVSGSLSNPSFGTGDIVRQAMQNALQNAAMSYVKNALQPLGTLMLVGNLAAKAARPRFEPVAMLPGQVELPAAGREYLDKLAGMLEERPGLSLTICGVATGADREALLEAERERLAAEAEAQQAAAGEAPVDVEGASGGDVSGEDSQAGEPPAPTVSDARLLELAGLRTTRVVSYIAGRDGVSRERLFACRETIEEASEDGPRVEITL